MLRQLLLGLCLIWLVPASVGFAFDGIRITLLGTGGGANAPADRAGPSALIEVGREILLFDCGRGVTQRLAQAGMSVGRVSRVFITHLHADNTVGCADLWTRGWLRGRDEALHVIGPKGTAAMMSHIEQAFTLDVQSRPLVNQDAARIDAKDITENVVYESDDVRVLAFVVEHGDMVPAYGYRVEAKGRAVVISGGTRYTENLVQNARRASVLIHEVTAIDKDLLGDSPMLNKESASHSSPEDVAKVLRATRPGLAVLAPQELIQVKENDVVRGVRSQYPGTIEIGYDLMVIEVQNEIQIRGVPSDRPSGR